MTERDKWQLQLSIMNKVFYMVFTLICFTSCKQKSNADFEKSLQNKSIEEIYKLASDLY